MATFKNKYKKNKPSVDREIQKEIEDLDDDFNYHTDSVTPKKKKHTRSTSENFKAYMNMSDEEMERLYPVELQQNTLMTRGVGKAVEGDAARYVIEERRKKVWELQQRGVDPSVIAQLLEVNITVIHKDIEENKKRFRDSAKDFDESLFVGDTLQMYVTLETQAWQQYEMSHSGKDKREYLGLIRSLRSDRTKLLQELGLVKRKGEGMAHTTININTIAHWGTEKRKELTKLLLGMDLPPLPEPEKDQNFEVIDGNYEEKEESDE